MLWKRRPVEGALGKLSCFCKTGCTYLGPVWRADRSDRERVWRTRAVQREMIEDHWPEDFHEMIHKTPWTKADEDEVPGETEKLVTEMTEAEKEVEKQFQLEDNFLARFYIRKVDLEKHGHTTNCPGCRGKRGVAGND